MKYLLLAGLAGIAAIGSAQQFQNDVEIDGTSKLQRIWTRDLNELGDGGIRSFAPSLAYSNITTSSNSTVLNGGTAAVSGILTTRYVSDLVNYSASGFGGQLLTRWQWSVANLNTTAVSARMRIRFHADNAGLPGTYLTGFSFAATSFAANSGSTFFLDTTANNILLPTNGRVWMGITFDNSGAAATTATQLDNLGQLLYNPPTAGSSADFLYRSTAANIGNVSNPAGGTIFFNGNPVANTYGQLNAVPEPASMAVLGLGAAALIRKRRSKKA